MSKIDNETVVKLARLARLSISPDEGVRLTAQLGSILKHVDKLSELNTDSVEPMTSLGHTCQPLRDDRVAVSLTLKDATANAGEVQDGYVVVPQIIHGSH